MKLIADEAWTTDRLLVDGVCLINAFHSALTRRSAANVAADVDGLSLEIIAM